MSRKLHHHLPTAAVVVAIVMTFAVEGHSRKRVDTVRMKVYVDRDRGGRVLCSLYDRSETWLSEDRIFRTTAVDVQGPWVTCVFRGVPAHHTYGIAALHDEDGDGEMDTNVIGLPLEGYAASRDAHFVGIGKPEWEDTSFRYRGGLSNQRTRMKY